MDGRTDRQLAMAILLFALASFNKKMIVLSKHFDTIILAFAT